MIKNTLFIMVLQMGQLLVKIQGMISIYLRILINFLKVLAKMRELNPMIFIKMIFL
jgi:hypothetical protein